MAVIGDLPLRTDTGRMAQRILELLQEQYPASAGYQHRSKCAFEKDIEGENIGCFMVEVWRGGFWGYVVLMHIPESNDRITMSLMPHWRIKTVLAIVAGIVGMICGAALAVLAQLFALPSREELGG